MRLCNFASGSKGNCTYLETEESHILIDIGIPAANVEHFLSDLNVSPSDIDGILISHEHSDHIKGLASFVKKYHTPVYVHHKVLDYFRFQVNAVEPYLRAFDTDFCINDLQIKSFHLSHDSNYCVGFRFTEGDAVASILTDCGVMNEHAFECIKGSALIYLESNYDEEMLYACPYPTWLKKRISGPNGHLSNTACAEVIEQLVYTGTRQVILSHISENSNTPLLAYNTAKAYLQSRNIIEGVNVRISVASQYERDTVFRIKNTLHD